MGDTPAVPVRPPLQLAAALALAGCAAAPTRPAPRPEPESGGGNDAGRWLMEALLGMAVTGVEDGIRSAAGESSEERRARKAEESRREARDALRSGWRKLEDEHHRSAAAAQAALEARQARLLEENGPGFEVGPPRP